MQFQMRDTKGRTELYNKEGIMVLRLKNWDEVQGKLYDSSKSTFQREKVKLIHFFENYLKMVESKIELRILLTGYEAGRDQDNILYQMIEWIDLMVGCEA